MSFGHFIPIVRIFLILATSASVLKAQAPKGPPPIQFSCVSWAQLSIPGLLYREGKVCLPLEVLPRNRSKLYPLHGINALELYILATDKEGKQSYQLVGKAPFPQGTDRALFIIDKKAPDGLPLTVTGVDDSLKVFPPGSFRFVNFTPAPLKVVFGGKTSPVAPEAMTVVKSNVSAEGGFLPFFIKDASERTVYENRLFGQPTGRDMIFIGPPARPGGRVSIILLPQLVAPPPPEPPAG